MNINSDNYLQWIDNRTLALCQGIRALNKTIKRTKKSDERELLVKLIDAKMGLASTLETHLKAFGDVNNYGYP